MWCAFCAMDEMDSVSYSKVTELLMKVELEMLGTAAIFRGLQHHPFALPSLSLPASLFYVSITAVRILPRLVRTA